jgi:hypothetical protein
VFVFAAILVESDGNFRETPPVVRQSLFRVAGVLTPILAAAAMVPANSKRLRP